MTRGSNFSSGKPNCSWLASGGGLTTQHAQGTDAPFCSRKDEESLGCALWSFLMFYGAAGVCPGI